ncbi:hypothetical protein BGZ70_010175 [Mortierella alpina]|uniref:Uncharacterized protein n=1 Tax=Mortierella alpina TaxID=64518 RepID=A0A9P6LZP9_MORAP|nr:hypothetical protein BGZ70_010175 [Mortierella alpina]
MAPSPPTASIASTPPVASSQPVLSYPESHRLDGESSASPKDTPLGSSLPTSDTSISALSFESSANEVGPSKEPIKIMELPECKPSSANDGVELDVKSENDTSVVAASPTLDVKDNPEEAATSSTSDNREGILTHEQEQPETDFVAIKAEKDSEPQIASTEDIGASMDASMNVTQDHERSEVPVEQALMKREPSAEPHGASLEDSGSDSTETGLTSQEAAEEPKDSDTTAKAETVECGTLLADALGQKATLPVIKSLETSTVESELPSPAESRSSSSRTALEQNNGSQALDHFKEPTSVHSAHESTETMDLGMELDHAMDDIMTTEASPEKPKAEGLSDSEPGDAPTSTDMELEEFPTVPDVENSSSGPTSPSRTEGTRAHDHGSHPENQPHLSSPPPKTFVAAHSVAQNGIRVYPSWHHVPGADMALLSEMRASTADLGRFRRETRWLEERVSRPRRDLVSEDMFDKALGLTRMRAVERTETQIKLKQRLGEQAEQKMREVLEKQAELDMELERVQKMEQEYLERREQQRRTAKEEVRQLEETLRTLQEQHHHHHHRLPHQPVQQ